MVRDGHHGRARTMDELIAADAPLPPGRALALMVAVTRTVAALDPERAPSRLEADQVRLHEDGSVSFEVPRRDEPAGSPAPEPELGASIGRLLFALLAGRPPVGRDDAFEPTLRAALAPSTCALIARSASEAPGQWPDVEEWTTELAHVAGTIAPPLPAPERRRARRRRALLVGALVLLALVSILVVWLAPRWWDAATDERSLGTGAGPSQLLRAMS